jgi:hypothetical protein
MKPEHGVFIREAVEITSLLDQSDSLLRELLAASAERVPALQAEIVELKERVVRFALHYQN